MASEEQGVEIDFALWPETAEERRAQAAIGEADIADCRARMAALVSAGRVLDDEGHPVVVSAVKTRAMLFATVK